jgi:hypothetical protein
MATRRDFEQVRRDIARMTATPITSQGADIRRNQGLLASFALNGNQYVREEIAINFDKPRDNTLLLYNGLLAPLGARIEAGEPPTVQGSNDITITAQKHGVAKDRLCTLSLGIESFLRLCAINGVNPASKLPASLPSSEKPKDMWRRIQEEEAAKKKTADSAPAR